MRLIDLETAKPEFQALKAAQELLDQNYTILFPCDTGHRLLARAGLSTAVNPPENYAEFVVSEDCDWQKFVRSQPEGAADFVSERWPGSVTLIFARAETEALAAGDKIALRMPAASPNRGFHTLVQLCDFPLRISGAAYSNRQLAEENLAGLEYGFWDAKLETPAVEVWDLTGRHPLKAV